jgi:hypothetical protein
MEWYVAPSYKSAKILVIKEESSNKAHIKIEEKCDRCGGTGIIASRVENGHIIPIPVDGGICYKCNGAGYIHKWVKGYTKKELDRYLANQEKSKAKKIEEVEQKRQSLIDNSETNKKALLERFGYDPENPKVYLIAGDNTYAIKDELKAAGARFDYALGWYFKQNTEVPAGYKLVEVDFDHLFDWNPVTKMISIKENAKEIAEAAISATMPKSLSEYVGDIKERLRDLQVTLTGARSFDGFYGTSFIYTFVCGENVLVWMTSSCKDIEVGDHFLLTGTVKEHSEYKGVKQTKLSRCIIKKGE